MARPIPVRYHIVPVPFAPTLLAGDHRKGGLRWLYENRERATLPVLPEGIAVIGLRPFETTYIDVTTKGLVPRVEIVPMEIPQPADACFTEIIKTSPDVITKYIGIV